MHLKIGLALLLILGSAANSAAWSLRTSQKWSLAALEQAISLPGYSQAFPLAQKLQNGQPITITAIGTSITADLGGCWHQKISDVTDLVTVLPGVYFLKPECGKDGAGGNPEGGWLDITLTRVNQTFPGRHAIVNMGASGTDFRNLVRGTCLEESIPRTTDLIVIERLDDISTDEGHEVFEQLLHRLFVHFGHGPGGDHGASTDDAPPRNRPAVLLVHTIRASRKDGTDPHQVCALSPPYHRYGPGDGAYSTAVEDRFNLVAQYYGIAAVSLRNFITSLFREGAVGPTASEQCAFLESVFGDRVHPRFGKGTQMFADIVTTYLNNVLAVYEAYKQQGGPQPPVLAQLPQQPLNPTGWQTMFSRCYGSSLKWQAGLEETQNAVGRSVPLQVVKAEGWSYMEYHEFAGRRKYKPGYITSTPGSVLQVTVNTKFRAGFTKTVLGLGFLKSYEHMGRASLSCVSGCTCGGGPAGTDPVVIDAHNADFQVSTEHVHEVPVSQAEQCVVELRVLPDTSSDGHKFKVIKVIVAALVDSAGGEVRWLLEGPAGRGGAGRGRGRGAGGGDGPVAGVTRRGAGAVGG